MDVDSEDPAAAFGAACSVQEQPTAASVPQPTAASMPQCSQPPGSMLEQCVPETSPFATAQPDAVNKTVEPDQPSSLPVSDRSASVSRSGLFDASQHVTWKLEWSSNRMIKALVGAVLASVALGLSLNIVLIIFKNIHTDHEAAQTNYWEVINIACCFLCFPPLAGMLCWYLASVRHCWKSGLHRSHLVWRATWLYCIELVAMLVNTMLFVIPNIYILIMWGSCALMDEHSIIPTVCDLLRWAFCWPLLFTISTLHGDEYCPLHEWKATWQGRLTPWVPKHLLEDRTALVLDAPWHIHWIKYLLGAGVAATGITFELYIEFIKQHPDVREYYYSDDVDNNCWDHKYSCEYLDGAGWSLLISQTVCLCAQLLLFISSIRATMHALRRLPYNKNRVSNISCRIESRLRTLPFIFIVFDITSYYYVEYNTCRSSWIANLGMTPAQVVATAVAVVGAYLHMPETYGKKHHGVYQAWLQEFAFSPKHLVRKRAARAELLSGTRQEEEPMFCVDTALRLAYWSNLVYDYLQVDGSEYNMDHGRKLLGLQEHQLMWERSSDTKALVAWGDSTVVMAFRGTASMRNVMHDAQVWQKHFRPLPGGDLPAKHRLARVHQGFLTAWQQNGFCKKLVQHVIDIINASKTEKVTVYATGHSLGGALASLAACDVSMELAHAGLSGRVDLQCYCFGAPRTGNHSFARLHRELVPNTWLLMNNVDVVPKNGKLLFLYKHAGKRVLINRQGSIIVNPSFVEMNLWSTPGASSIADHLLGSYGRALAAVVMAQFTDKRVEGSGKDVGQLLQDHDIQQMLKMHGFLLEVCMRISRCSYKAGVQQKLQRKLESALKLRRIKADDEAERGLLPRAALCMVAGLRTLCRLALGSLEFGLSEADDASVVSSDLQSDNTASLADLESKPVSSSPTPTRALNGGNSSPGQGSRPEQDSSLGQDSSPGQNSSLPEDAVLSIV